MYKKNICLNVINITKFNLLLFYLRLLMNTVYRVSFITVLVMAANESVYRVSFITVLVKTVHQSAYRVSFITCQVRLIRSISLCYFLSNFMLLRL